MNRELPPPYQPKYADFKLSVKDELWLLSIAIPAWIRQSGKSPVQVWFETFIDYADKLGYTVVKKETL